jgi:uncharacterized membrane protein YkvA (DUF1232 family)
VRALLSILLHLPRYLRLSWRLLRDPDVPRYLKWMVAGAMIYAIWPLDLIPDFTVIGIAEDLALLVLSIRNLVRMSPTHVVTRHARAIADRSEPPTKEDSSS